MCACFNKPLEEGAFTIHRNENMYWSGTLTDMKIEQSMNAIWEKAWWTRQYHAHGVSKDNMVAHISHC